MQVEDDYCREVYNGDLRVVSRIDAEAGQITVDFDGRDVIYGFGELDELVLACATTIHKSQGSEYPAVVIPLSIQHYPMLRRNLVYTGVTWEAPGRARRAAQGVGDRRQGRPEAGTMVEAKRVARAQCEGQPCACDTVYALGLLRWIIPRASPHRA